MLVLQKILNTAAISKLVTMMIITVMVVLIFTLSTWVVFGVYYGFSNQANAIQALNSFILCPVVITVGQYFIIALLLKILVFLAFSFLMLLISAFLNNYDLIYICGFAFLGLNILLHSISYPSINNPFKNFNFISAAIINPIFQRYLALNLFGGVSGYITLTAVFFVAILIMSCVVSVVVFVRMTGRAEFKRFAFLSSIIAGMKKTRKNIASKISGHIPNKRGYSSSLIIAESYKTLIAKRYIFVVAFLLLVKIFISANAFAPVKTFEDSVYNEYMTLLEGEINDEKREYIREEREFIQSVLNIEKDMRRKYVEGEIGFEDYITYNKDYTYAVSRDKLFAIIEEHAAYIDQIKTEKNINVWFV